MRKAAIGFILTLLLDTTAQASDFTQEKEVLMQRIKEYNEVIQEYNNAIQNIQIRLIEIQGIERYLEKEKLEKERLETLPEQSSDLPASE